MFSLFPVLARCASGFADIVVSGRLFTVTGWSASFFGLDSLPCELSTCASDFFAGGETLVLGSEEVDDELSEEDVSCLLRIPCVVVSTNFGDFGPVATTGILVSLAEVLVDDGDSTVVCRCETVAPLFVLSDSLGFREL